MIDFLLGLMSVDSTSGKENSAVEWLCNNYNPTGSQTVIQEIPNGKKNVFYKWGEPKIIFCSHFDTVHPYIPPTEKDGKIYGRGSCDAKGQLAVMATVCENLYSAGESDFGLLMLAGEEVGSYGAKTANSIIDGCKFVIVGEPTENKLIKASKGNILFSVKITGRSCHSGYPELGDNAIDRARIFLNKLNELNFSEDSILGQTTFNIGGVVSNNAHNVVSDSVEMKIFVRTTFQTHNVVTEKIKSISDENTRIEEIYGDPPIEFKFIEGFNSGVVSYGSDAPELRNLGTPLLYGPGSIYNAHTMNEHIIIEDLNLAIQDLTKIYLLLKINI